MTKFARMTSRSPLTLGSFTRAPSLSRKGFSAGAPTGPPRPPRLPAIVAEGLSLVIVEQDIVQALKVANHVICLQEGRVVALAGNVVLEWLFGIKSAAIADDLKIVFSKG